MPASLSNKTKALKLSKQAQGMLAKVIAMIEQDDDCPSIVQQADSVCGFLQSVKRELLASHLESCVMKESPADRQRLRKELLKLYHLSDAQ